MLALTTQRHWLIHFDIACQPADYPLRPLTQKYAEKYLNLLGSFEPKSDLQEPFFEIRSTLSEFSPVVSFFGITLLKACMAKCMGWHCDSFRDVSISFFRGKVKVKRIRVTRTGSTTALCNIIWNRKGINMQHLYNIKTGSITAAQAHGKSTYSRRMNKTIAKNLLGCCRQKGIRWFPR